MKYKSVTFSINLSYECHYRKLLEHQNIQSIRFTNQSGRNHEINSPLNQHYQLKREHSCPAHATQIKKENIATVLRTLDLHFK